MSGPATNAMPKTAPNRPWYLPRSAGVNRSPMTASAIGNSGAGADALDAAEEDELRHVLGQAGQGRADQEDDDADHEHRLAAVEVGQLAVERDADRAGQQVDRDDPDVEVVAAQLGDDRRQRRADDRLVEGAQEQPEHDREEDLELLPGWLRPSAGSSSSVGIVARRRSAGKASISCLSLPSVSRWWVWSWPAR